MTKSIKLNNNTYLDCKGVDYKHTNLEKTLDNIISKNNSQDTNISQLTNNLAKITDIDITANETYLNYKIAGKKVYAKAIEGTTSSEVNTIVRFGSNLLFRNWYGVIYYPPENTFIPINYPNNDAVVSYAHIGSDSYIQLVINNGAFRNRNYLIVAEYVHDY